MSVKRIKLKEKSPQFVDDKPKAKAGTTHCDMPGCPSTGEFRAPKDRGLRDYYCFCETHIREYNAAWDFFDGMSQIDIEKHMRDSLFGDRPTWIYTAAPGWEDQLRAKAAGYRDFEDEEKPRRERQAPGPQETTPERDALIIMGLEPPVTFNKIKERYRTLMKTYHPDLKPGDAQAEELVKRVNMAYTILRAAHEKFEKISV